MNGSKQEELRGRTKRFALRIIRLFQHLPRSPEPKLSVGSCCGQARLSERITEQLAEQGREQSLR